MFTKNSFHSIYVYQLFNATITTVTKPYLEPNIVMRVGISSSRIFLESLVQIQICSCLSSDGCKRTVKKIFLNVQSTITISETIHNGL